MISFRTFSTHWVRCEHQAVIVDLGSGRGRYGGGFDPKAGDLEMDRFGPLRDGLRPGEVQPF
jgi:hypothetical protein